MHLKRRLAQGWCSAGRWIARRVTALSPTATDVCRAGAPLMRWQHRNPVPPADLCTSRAAGGRNSMLRSLPSSAKAEVSHCRKDDCLAPGMGSRFSDPLLWLAFMQCSSPRQQAQGMCPPVHQTPDPRSAASGKPAITPKNAAAVNARAFASGVYRGLTAPKNLWITLDPAALNPYNLAALEQVFHNERRHVWR